MTEHQLQAAFFDWVHMMANCDTRYRWAYAIPNGMFLISKDAKRRAQVMNKMKKEGLCVGVSDVCIPYPTKRYHGLYIEFKTPKTRPTFEQKEFLLEMRERGYCANYVVTVDDAISLAKHYMDFDVK